MVVTKHFYQMHTVQLQVTEIDSPKLTAADVFNLEHNIIFPVGLHFSLVFFAYFSFVSLGLFVPVLLEWYEKSQKIPDKNKTQKNKV